MNSSLVLFVALTASLVSAWFPNPYNECTNVPPVSTTLCFGGIGTTGQFSEYGEGCFLNKDCDMMVIAKFQEDVKEPYNSRIRWFLFFGDVESAAQVHRFGVFKDLASDHMKTDGVFVRVDKSKSTYLAMGLVAGAVCYRDSNMIGDAYEFDAFSIHSEIMHIPYNKKPFLVSQWVSKVSIEYWAFSKRISYFHAAESKGSLLMVTETITDQGLKLTNKFYSKPTPFFIWGKSGYTAPPDPKVKPDPGIIIETSRESNFLGVLSIVVIGALFIGSGVVVLILY